MKAQCCVCGFVCSHGVLTAHSSAEGPFKSFVCERCFGNPNIFSVAKRWLPHWTLAIKHQQRRNGFARKGPEVHPFDAAILTKKSKREVAMSESLYSGQRQLCSFAEASL